MRVGCYPSALPMTFGLYSGDVSLAVKREALEKLEYPSP